MSNFQDQLEKEIDKRGLRDKDAESDSAEILQKPKKSLFSFAAFFKGLVVCSLFSAGIIGWAWFKSADTAKINAEKLGSKTTIIQKDASDIYRLGGSESQPVLRMPSVDLTDKEAPQNIPETHIPKPHILETKTSETSPISPITTDDKNSLVPAPVPGLYENASEGMLPIIRKEDNISPFEAYKRPFQKTSEKPLLSIIFFNMGLSRKMTEGLIQNLPAEVSFSFSPYAQDLKLLTDISRKAGHEVWLTLPMETKNYPFDDPGPLTLLVNASVEQNKGRLTSILASTQGYVGFVSQKNHIFKREDANVNPAFQEVFDRGLAILDSKPSLYSFVGDLASKNDYPNAKNNFWLDDDLTPLALNKKIRQIIEYGKSGGSLIVMVRPYPTSVKALQKFLHSAAADRFQLAPVSAQIEYGE